MRGASHFSEFRLTGEWFSTLIPYLNTQRVVELQERAVLVRLDAYTIRNISSGISISLMSDVKQVLSQQINNTTDLINSNTDFSQSTGYGRNNSHILKVNNNQTRQGTQKILLFIKGTYDAIFFKHF